MFKNWSSAEKWMLAGRLFQIVVAAILAIAIIHGCNKKTDEWCAFKVANNCRVVEDLQVVTRWTCDDGVTYWR